MALSTNQVRLSLGVSSANQVLDGVSFPSFVIHESPSLTWVLHQVCFANAFPSVMEVFERWYWSIWQVNIEGLSHVMFEVNISSD